MPHATTAQACGANRSIHVQVVIGWPVWRSVPKPAQYPFSLLCLVRDRTFDHQDERLEQSVGRPMERSQKVFAGLESQHRVVQRHPGQSGDRPQQNIFQAGLRGRRDGNRIAIAPQSGRDPQNLDGRDRRFVSRLLPVKGSFHAGQHPCRRRSGPAEVSAVHSAMPLGHRPLFSSRTDPHLQLWLGRLARMVAAPRIKYRKAQQPFQGVKPAIIQWLDEFSWVALSATLLASPPCPQTAAPSLFPEISSYPGRPGLPNA